MVAYTYEVHDTTAPVSTSCQASHYCCLQDSHLDMTDDYFSPPVACIAPINTIRANHYG